MSVAIGYVPGAFGQGGDDPEFLKKLVKVDTEGNFLLHINTVSLS